MGSELISDSLRVSLLKVRMASPAWVRKLYRLARALTTQSPSKNNPPDLVVECRCFASRYAMLDALPREGRVTELGTYKGDFALEILKRVRPQELHLVDLDFSRLNSSVHNDGRVTIHEGFTHKIVALFEDDSFDWIYIDADHSYEGTLRDAEVSARKVKRGGYLVFNDFAHTGLELDRYGVHRAVVDFAVSNQWPFKYFAFDANGLYDVALQRP